MLYEFPEVIPVLEKIERERRILMYRTLPLKDIQITDSFFAARIDTADGDVRHQGISGKGEPE